MEEKNLMTELNDAAAKLHTIIRDIYKDKDISKLTGREKIESTMSYAHIITNNIGKQVLLQMHISMPEKELRIKTNDKEKR